MGEASTKNRHVLCFDGTSNRFQANSADTNIVKIYEMLDRETSDQYHYYQPGIGTYDADGPISNTRYWSVFSKVWSKLKAKLDEGFAFSFAEHVMAGYKFLMRYYANGDDIYIFGFSRGAYTARVLSEMIHDIGLLSRGNEEHVSFAWYKWSDYCRAGYKEKDLDYINDYKKTFCRKDVKVHFLGLFDCVNSVANLEVPLFRRISPYLRCPPATHIRHAVSVHERRAKFKPTLFLFAKKHLQEPAEVESLKEHWFAGNHGDVGGGWPVDPGCYALSEIALKWMVDQVLAIQPSEQNNPLSWHKTDPEDPKKGLDGLDSRVNHIHESLQGGRGKELGLVKHDLLVRGGGSSWLGRRFWWLLELLPLSHFELEGDKWVQPWSSNIGGLRDIPEDVAINNYIDPSIDLMVKADVLPVAERPFFGEKPFRGYPYRGLWNLWGLVGRRKISARPATADGEPGH
ncbi:hypothetical protein PV08_10960 [Exophiala spinifera]|uniref:T6SS Phospholipase effector Tle1-like catalytic domain-containing protein n=1 Tax=Exophiala spinifera TaxID=91928 RepID=A0A0D2AY72_9EURO|nr:uncharacterized protein PV08_10960 [Exophiala spinifera]KIW11658.1 hypothetical protein PV08_10960 [Exophiala spinifera]